MLCSYSERSEGSPRVARVYGQLSSTGVWAKKSIPPTHPPPNKRYTLYCCNSPKFLNQPIFFHRFPPVFSPQFFHLANYRSFSTACTFVFPPKFLNQPTFFHCIFSLVLSFLRTAQNKIVIIFIWSKRVCQVFFLCLKHWPKIFYSIISIFIPKIKVYLFLNPPPQHTHSKK